jgi:hypothetical protein
MAEPNLFALAFGLPQITVEVVSVLFDSALRDSVGWS